MNLFTSKTFLSTALFSLTLCSATSALSQATDSAQSMITLTYMDAIQIANVDNVPIQAPPAGSGDFAAGSDVFCVAGTGSFTSFGITFANAGTDPSFFLQPSVAGASPMTYEVFFSNSTQGQGTMVTAGVPVQGNVIQANNCADDNARFDVRIPPAEWEGRAGDAPFMGMLVITVEAE
ncbi:hypothetical protein ACJJIU_04550 [Microbulbifer sp. CnH-101-E]|uniref:hypothetical protein n=1 Tax=unclassified Microbulbifer TaxID=2619833 RepID=UPI00403A639F